MALGLMAWCYLVKRDHDPASQAAGTVPLTPGGPEQPKGIPALQFAACGPPEACLSEGDKKI